MDRIVLAFAKFDRRDFLPKEIKKLAHNDWALPIGYEQTNSQPTTVKVMLHWLDAQPGDKVLDVGSGSGWTAALLSYIVGPKGKIYAVEVVPELVEFGRKNAKKTGVKNAKFHQADKTIGLSKYAPYDRILVSAAGRQVPEELLKQLADGGKMVIPVNNDILEIKKENGKVTTKKHPGFVFVPLITD